ncbi:hypothetical protein Afil01_44440 [Actinorhabdospora filicis]|uniref:Metallo-beta-lactamase domain-containing protein n=2 Tax=Actinorhabdospora filicis TaxID=1785913 RepID=A0A9W6SPR8_9ACTN|nr:hypothetical protein Afil01_44440 [Actinorhabdospora filicis]
MTTRRTLLAAALGAGATVLFPSASNAANLRPMDLDVTWHHGWPSAKHDPAPEIQVHQADARTYILRQNRSVNFEAPFMYLLIGRHTALLIDTGATPEAEYFPLREVVDGLVPHGHRLIVAHSHGHGDHVAADEQFTGRGRTTIVGKGQPEVAEYYGFTDWPHTPRELDLGGRVVDVIPSPGHHASAVTFYDRRTGALLTGDTVYPGRLYVQDWDAFAATIDRLVAWSDAHEVSHVLGCHIEMSIEDGQDYPRGWNYTPYERALPMTVEDLRDVQAAVAEAGGAPGIHKHAAFHLWYKVDG